MLASGEPGMMFCRTIADKAMQLAQNEGHSVHDTTNGRLA
jgi:hypothetical protein